VSYGYDECVELAGGTVLCAKPFGDYQGTIWMKVVHPDGRTGWCAVYYGSCSGCDTLEHLCMEYSGEKLVAKKRQEGKSILSGLMTQREAEKSCGGRSWDLEADTVIAFLRANA
jgi:hypothetical protein